VKKAEEILAEEPTRTVQSPQGFQKEFEWDLSHMASTLLYSLRSHCTRYKVACLIVKDRRPLVVGINGTPPGALNCDDHFCNAPGIGEVGYAEYYDEHAKFSAENEQHAEMNALSWCARKGISIEGATMYTTLTPCTPCAKAIVAAQINRFCYLELYDRDPRGAQYLTDHGVQLVKLYAKNIQTELRRAIFALDPLLQ
jgi:dCMP deaminase